LYSRTHPRRLYGPGNTLPPVDLHAGNLPSYIHRLYIFKKEKLIYSEVQRIKPPKRWTKSGLNIELIFSIAKLKYNEMRYLGPKTGDFNSRPVLKTELYDIVNVCIPINLHFSRYYLSLFISTKFLISSSYSRTSALQVESLFVKVTGFNDRVEGFLVQHLRYLQNSFS